MSGLLGPNGQPITDYLVGKTAFTNKKEAPPKLGESFGRWAGDDLKYMSLPGGGVIQFDLSKLTLADFRSMTDHYQINASLSVLSFMQHQSDWHIECENKEHEAFYEEQLSLFWTPLNRALSTANWAGFSPNVIQYDNDVSGRRVVIDKVKDLAPEDCVVNWKLVDGWAPPDRTPPKFKVYDGIKQLGAGWPIPVESTLWFPMLMENGDYYGKKLLRPAFQSWFFSHLLHLFANRYYERFGEPVPVGRAPFDESVSVGGQSVDSRDYMGMVINQLRSRSVVVMPSERQIGADGKDLGYDYDLEYLESQMRGADFERYMTRLDEEMSIGLFTPILLLRTADVGSYNLGQGHERIYQMMVNALNSDRKYYIDNYLLRRLRDFNFGTNAPAPRIVYRKMGNVDATMLKEMMVALLQQNKASVDLKEFGQAVGMTLTEVEQTTAPAPAPGGTPAEPPVPPGGAGFGTHSRAATGECASVAAEIVNRIRPQVENAFSSGEFPERFSMGYKRKMQSALVKDGVTNPERAVEDVYGHVDHWFEDITSSLRPSDFGSSETLIQMFAHVMDVELANAKG
jgi:hypothetical protein